MKSIYSAPSPGLGGVSLHETSAASRGPLRFVVRLVGGEIIGCEVFMFVVDFNVQLELGLG